MSIDDRWLKPKEVAAYLGISEATLASWRASGNQDLPWVKCGAKVIRYRLGAVETFMARSIDNKDIKE